MTFAQFLTTRRAQLGHVTVGTMLRALQRAVRKNSGTKLDPNEAVHKNAVLYLIRGKTQISQLERSLVDPSYVLARPAFLLIIALAYQLDRDLLRAFLESKVEPSDEVLAALCLNLPFNPEASWVDLLDQELVEQIGRKEVLDLGKDSATNLFQMIGRVKKAMGMQLDADFIKMLMDRWEKAGRVARVSKVK